MADVKENGHHQGNGDNNSVAGEAEGEESNDSGPGLAGIILSSVERWWGRGYPELFPCFDLYYKCQHMSLKAVNI